VFDILRQGRLHCVPGVALHKRAGGIGNWRPPVPRNAYYLRRLFCFDEALYLAKYFTLPGSPWFRVLLAVLLACKYGFLLVTTNLNRLAKLTRLP
jgi:hypothetical protein